MDDVEKRTTGNPAWVVGFGSFLLNHIWLRIGNPDRRDELKLSFGPAGQAHFLAVMEAWGTLQTEMDRFSHVPRRQRMA